VRQKARPEKILLWGFILLMMSCNNGESDSPYDQSYIEFRLSAASELGYADLQSIKVYVDPYAAFNLLNMHEKGRSLLGAYDYNETSEIYMGFEYSPLYISRLEDLRVSVTRKGTQEFLDSGTYTLTFMGEIPEEAEEKPFISISVTAAGVVSLSAVDGIQGAPSLSLVPDP